MYHDANAYYGGIYGPTIPFVPSFKIPRVVPNQRHKFYNDDLLKKLSKDSEIKFTGYQSLPLDVRRSHFHNACNEGKIDIAFTNCGINIPVVFGTAQENFFNFQGECDFNRHHKRVYLKSRLIMNGVCVILQGWIDLDLLEGFACLEFDEERAALEGQQIYTNAPTPYFAG